MAECKNRREQMYEEKRQRTETLIQNAIDDIKADGREVTKKELILVTGLSSGTFSTDRVKEILKKNKVCQFRTPEDLHIAKTNKIKAKSADDMLREINRLKSKVQDAKLQHDLDSKRLDKLEQSNKDLVRENMLLRGKYQTLLEYLDARGIAINDFINI